MKLKKHVIEPENVVFDSFIWNRLKTILIGKLIYSRKRLESCNEMIECARSQSEIKLLEAILNLPETGTLVLLDENKTKKEK